MTKYKQYFQQMVEQNTELFESFREIHDLFLKNRLAHQDEFNEIGRDVVDVIRDWERRLCASMGRGQFGGYSHRLADKFWDEVRKSFSAIDLIGVRIKKEAND
ncbi:MAG: hypothetical protein ACOZAN_05175 [Patescibacteria group bacterium]